MGCRYNPYGEKVEEGLYQDGELAKSMRGGDEKMPLLPENPENPAYEAYRKGPEYGIELPVCGGIYTGVLKNGLPNGRGPFCGATIGIPESLSMGLLPAGACCIKMTAPLSKENSLWSRPDLQALGILSFENGIEYWYQ